MKNFATVAKETELYESLSSDNFEEVRDYYFGVEYPTGGQSAKRSGLFSSKHRKSIGVVFKKWADAGFPDPQMITGLSSPKILNAIHEYLIIRYEGKQIDIEVLVQKSDKATIERSELTRSIPGKNKYETAVAAYEKSIIVDIDKENKFSLQTPELAQAGSKITFNWEGPTSFADFIDIAPKGNRTISSGIFRVFLYKNGPITLYIPHKPSQYDIRYIQEGIAIKAISTITVQ